MKLISLTQGKFAKIDDEDFEWLNQWKWYAKRVGNTYYAVRMTAPNRKKHIAAKMIQMHSEIMQTPHGMEVDHKDHDGLNNQRENMRICTRRENSYNRIKPSNNTSGYIGVTWDKANQKWKALMGIDGKGIYLGSYEDVKDAARAYDEAAKQYHGEFANINLD